jgi:hypothetical protein
MKQKIQKNVLILGSGRSGTSMVSGTLAKTGYFMGDDLYPPRESNPKGFFEGPEINGINEQILALIDFKHLPFLQKMFLKFRIKEHTPMGDAHRWLERVPLGVKMPATPEIIERIKKTTQQTPFCYKDPRFCYTLPIWRPYLRDTVFICVFREPAATAKSIVKECGDVDHLRNEIMDFQIALEVWTLMYLHILKIQRREGKWLFIHFNQVLTREGLDLIEEFTGASIDRSFPEPSLKRSFSDIRVPKRVQNIYNQLCELAGYKGFN